GAALLRDLRGWLSAGQVSSARRSRKRRAANPDIGVPAALTLKGDDLDAVTAIVGVNDHQLLPNSSVSKGVRGKEWTRWSSPPNWKESVSLADQSALARTTTTRTA